MAKKAKFEYAINIGEGTSTDATETLIINSSELNGTESHQQVSRYVSACLIGQDLG